MIQRDIICDLASLFNTCRELLRGPLYYVMILILCAVVFWRESPDGVISLSMMCGGDGNNPCWQLVFSEFCPEIVKTIVTEYNFNFF